MEDSIRLANPLLKMEVMKDSRMTRRSFVLLATGGAFISAFPGLCGASLTTRGKL